MKKWRCRVCGYIHEGPEPPDVCPVCGAPKEEFEEVIEEADATQRSASESDKSRQDVTSSSRPGEDSSSVSTVSTARQGPSSSPVAPTAAAGDSLKGALYSLSYGLVVVTSRKNDRFNGQACNTVMQITSEPVRIALAINKRNLTHEFINESKVLAVTVLGKDNLDLVRRFGFASGRTTDKLAGVEYTLGTETGCPILKQGIAFLEARLAPGLSVDAGTHTLFLADVVGGGTLRDSEPMTYHDYRELKNKSHSQMHAAEEQDSGQGQGQRPGDAQSQTQGQSEDRESEDHDRQNVIAALNLEYGANRRYQYQIERFTDPGLVSALRGIMLTEGDHIENNLGYLTRSLDENGWSWALLNLKLNLEFEETARDTYRKFASEAKDPELAKMFKSQAQSEQGHVNIFRELISEIEGGSRPVRLYCPLCGWEMHFGTSPEPGTKMRCPKCGVIVGLGVEDGQWVAELEGRG